MEDGSDDTRLKPELREPLRARRMLVNGIGIMNLMLVSVTEVSRWERCAARMDPIEALRHE